MTAALMQMVMAADSSAEIAARINMSRQVMRANHYAPLRATEPHSGIVMRALSCAGVQGMLHSWTGTFITFKGVRIARREENGTWFALEPGWTVTPAGMSEVHIQLNGSDGVILPYRLGKR
jgi:hypothetical protein